MKIYFEEWRSFLQLLVVYDELKSDITICRERNDNYSHQTPV